MSKIFEVFGYPLSDQSEIAASVRHLALCPFMGTKCDGGGNRPQSNLDLKNNPDLSNYFKESGLDVVPSGVCSLQLDANQSPWIVCPRRLLFLGKGNTDTSLRGSQDFIQNILLGYLDFTEDKTIGVWPEIKLKYSEGEAYKNFDYTFDYVLMSLGRLEQAEIEEIIQLPWKTIYPIIRNAGYTLTHEQGTYYVDGFPIGTPVIVEIMTSSTSGGNKNDRTTIPMAFEDAILHGNHSGPGINYRQIWARMLSQLIVKSELGLAWGGKTIWVLQDTLVDYISRSTALDVHYFRAEKTSEVNLLSVSYDSNFETNSGIIELRKVVLYAGPIQPKNASKEPSFQDMIRIALVPPLSKLFQLLSARKPATVIESIIKRLG